MAGNHLNFALYRAIKEDAAAGVRPVIPIIIGTSRAPSVAGGLINHHLRRFGPLRGEWAWALSGDQVNHPGSSVDYGVHWGGGSNPNDGNIPTYSEVTGTVAAQAAAWQFLATPCAGGAAAYIDTDNTTFNIPSISQKTIKNRSLELVVVHRTFTSGSGLINVVALANTANNGQPQDTKSISTFSSSVQTQYDVVPLPHSVYDANGGRSVYLNVNPKPAYVLGTAVRDRSMMGGFFHAMLVQGGGRNPRHFLDELTYVVGPDSLAEFIRVLVNCCGHPNPIIMPYIEFGPNYSLVPAAVGPSIYDTSKSQTFQYNALSGGIGDPGFSLVGWTLTFLDKGYAATNHDDFPTRTVATHDRGTGALTYNEGALPSMVDSWCQVRGNPPTYNLADQTTSIAEFRYAGRGLYDLLNGACSSLGYDCVTVFTGTNASDTIPDATVNAYHDAFVTEFTGVGNAVVVDIGPRVCSTSRLAAHGTTDYTHPPESAFSDLDDAAWDDGIAQTDAAGYRYLSGCINAFRARSEQTAVQGVSSGSTVVQASLTATGLDSISIAAPTGVPTNFRQMLVMLYRRFFKKTTLTSTQLKTYADDGTTVIATQSVSDNGTTQQQGEAA